MRGCRFHRQNSHTVPSSSTASIDATRKSLLVQLPVGIELELNAVSGSADVSLLEGLAAQVDFSTTSGRLDNTAPAGGAEVCRIDAESVSGGLTVRSVSALPAMD